jgi:hypothetical protein
MTKKPSRDFDVELAKKFLGLQVWFDIDKREWLCYDLSAPTHVVVLPYYSTNNEHSYRIIHEIKERGYGIQIGSVMLDEIIWRGVVTKVKGQKRKDGHEIIGESLAHVVCLAAESILDGSNEVEFKDPEKVSAKIIKLKPKKED